MKTPIRNWSTNVFPLCYYYYAFLYELKSTESRHQNFDITIYVLPKSMAFVLSDANDEVILFVSDQ